MSSAEYWIWLSAQAELSAEGKAALLAHYGDAETAFFAPKGDYAKVRGLRASEAALLEKRDLGGVNRIWEKCERQKIKIVTQQDEAYPRRLKYISAPPAVLYVKGNMPVVDEEAAIAVIGTRKATVYGVKMAYELTRGIVHSGGAVISVLSSRVDVAAAKAALLADGCVIGVLATAHERNKTALVEDITRYGAVISEHPPGTPAFRSHFRERNRLAAGLSAGVLVIEAPEKSGTLLFAHEALDQGKEIFAVPVNADEPNSLGTTRLLQEGAKAVTCAWDVMSEFELRFPDKVRKPAPEPPGEGVGRTQAASTEKKAVDKREGSGYIDLRSQLSELNETQLKIISVLEKEPSQIDDIIEETGLSTAVVLAQLTLLEIKGVVKRDVNRRVALNIAKK